MSLFHTKFPRAEVLASGRIEAAPASVPSLDELESIEARAKDLRARTIATGVKRLFRPVSQWLEARVQRAQEADMLSRMTDRQLADMGLTRADVWRLAR